MNDMSEKYMEGADRGFIYEFLETDGTTNKDVLIVSSSERAMDRIVSILVLGDFPYGYDVVEVKYNGRKRYAHCGLVTYCSRERLGRKICQVSQKVMDQITLTVVRQLGYEHESVFYKKAYWDLLEKYLEKE